MQTTGNDNVFVSSATPLPHHHLWHLGNTLFMPLVWTFLQVPKQHGFVYCASKVAKDCRSVQASFHQGDINGGECLKSPDIMGRRRGNGVVAVVVY